MGIDLDRAFGIHAQALELRSRRAELLAANLANADTPHYKARDVDFRAVLQSARAGAAAQAPRITHARHLGAVNTARDAEVLYRTQAQPTLDGNSVDVHREQSEFAQNAVQYQASLRFLSGRIRELLLAIRGD